MQKQLVSNLKTPALIISILMLLSIPAIVYMMHHKQIRLHAKSDHWAIKKNWIQSLPVKPLQLLTK